MKHVDGHQAKLGGLWRRSGRRGVQGDLPRQRHQPLPCATTRSAVCRLEKTPRARRSWRSSTTAAPTGAARQHRRHRGERPRVPLSREPDPPGAPDPTRVVGDHGGGREGLIRPERSDGCSPLRHDPAGTAPSARDLMPLAGGQAQDRTSPRSVRGDVDRGRLAGVATRRMRSSSGASWPSLLQHARVTAFGSTAAGVT